MSPIVLKPQHQVSILRTLTGVLFFVGTYATLILLPIPFVPTPIVSAQEPPTSEVENLIELLDSPTFKEREWATNKLGLLNGEAVDTMARSLVFCSPEASYRLKLALEKICTAGDEADFYKCASILKARFGISDLSIRDRLIELKLEWSEQMKKRAVAELKPLGLDVESPETNIQNQLELNRLYQFTADYNAIPPAGKNRRKAKPIDYKLLDLEIANILNSSPQENQKRILEDTELANSKPADQLPPDRFGDQGFLIQQGNVRTIISRDGYRLNQVSTQVKVQRDAQTQNRTFELLRNVGAIEKVEFSDRTIAPDELSSFFEVTGNLTQLTFANCDLKPLAESKVAWPNRVMTVEVKNSTLTADQTKPILAISGLSKLIFQNCEVAPGALDKFNESKNLVSMEFSSMEISSQLFQSLANLNRVTSLQLSGVKFDKDDYQKLLAARPELEVVFTARAFLGVRGPLNVRLDDPGCEISTVIPNSGAAEAGILEGDVIESVNGQRIIRFEDLRIQVAQHVPGDVLKIRVARGGKRLTLDVKLKDVSTAPQY